MVRWQKSTLSPSSCSALLSSTSHSGRLFQKVIKGFDFPCSGKALSGHLRKSKQRVFLSLQTEIVSESFAVAAGSNLLAWGRTSKEVLPLFLYWVSWRVKTFLMLCKFWVIFFMWKRNYIDFARTCYKLKQSWLLAKFCCSLGEIRHLKKSSCSKLILVHGSRAKLTPVQEMKECSDANWKSTDTSNAEELKLENNL